MFTKTPPKGMRDILPQDLSVREQVLDVIKTTYRGFGFLGIETPCVEDLGLLTGKQGGDNEKLIFKILKRGEKLDLNTQSEEGQLCDLGLRYDLTVPLSRYYACNQGKLPSVFKAMQIGNVWRAERPQKGRFRQFVQCDIDIIGEESYLAEVELITATSKALSNLGLKDFVIRINDRRMLTSFAEYCGFESARHEALFIALDKLDKIGIDGVREELSQHGFDVDKTEKFLNLINDLTNGEDALQCAAKVNAEAAENLQRIKAVTSVSAHDCRIVFDPTLVRGMNYYTGTIFEVSYGDFGISVAGGGRYDKMLGMFLGTSVPACGFSIGFERICTILEQMNKDEKPTQNKIAYIVDKDISVENLQKVLADSEEKRQQGNVCMLAKKIKNFGFLLKQLREQGFETILMLDNDGIRKVD